ncbi:MAG: class I SAM-dependent methyltransferase [Verrucomicrobia bacterium]|nr:class I SAM-dependent methyltransferase [Verrucomicrobiota bacterium]MBI3870681.1 class I SAM-dependent methyltransferase [Verrucomicrobiota bacterium]
MITRERCPICGSGASDPALSLPFDDADLQRYLSHIGFGLPQDWFRDIPFALHECRPCGLLYQRHALDPDQSAVLYGANKSGRRLAADHAPLALAHLAQDALLARQLLAMDSPRVLDFGMGWGRFALLAQGFGFEVHGVEMSESAREHAARHGICLRELEDLRPAEFDFILIDQVLEHLVAPLPLFQRLAESVKPGGLVLVGVPGRPGLLKKIRSGAGRPSPASKLSIQDIDAVAPMIHLNLFSNQSLRALASRAGLEPYAAPLLKTLGSGMLWNSARQWNRTPLLAMKYRWGMGTRLWLRKPAGRP